MSELTVNQLYLFADELATKWWGVPYGGVIELKSRRWKNINGQFLAPRNVEDIEEVPPVIRMCKKRNAERTEEEIKRTLLHELVHWRLFICGKPHRDTSREFVREAVRVGAPISKAKAAQWAYEEYLRGGERQ